MRIRNKIYCGMLTNTPEKWEIFRWAGAMPTNNTHGKKYRCVVGHFRTLAGAKFMRDHGPGNPHCQCVADAERLAKKYNKVEPAISSKRFGNEPHENEA